MTDRDAGIEEWMDESLRQLIRDTAENPILTPGIIDACRRADRALKRRRVEQQELAL